MYKNLHKPKNWKCIFSQLCTLRTIYNASRITPSYEFTYEKIFKIDVVLAEKIKAQILGKFSKWKEQSDGLQMYFLLHLQWQRYDNTTKVMAFWEHSV